MRSAGSGGSWTGGANRSWKERWDAVLPGSMIAAAALHLAAFLLVPGWSVGPGEMRSSRDLWELRPVLTHQVEIDEPGPAQEGGSVPEETAPLEAGLQEMASGLAVDFLEPLAIVAPYPPALSPLHLAQPGGRGDGTGGPASRLDQLPFLEPELARVGASVEWPRIRNPAVILRFLSSASDRLRTDPNPSGPVTLALWIDERGVVEWAEIKESSGSPGLDQIALSAFHEVVSFAPARDAGRAVSMGVLMSVPFSAPW